MRETGRHTGTYKDFSEEDLSLGEVVSTISLNLVTLPDNAEINITTSNEPDSEASSVFVLAAVDAGMDDINIAYTINVKKTNLVNGTDIDSATITMVVGLEWVEANGGVYTIRIIRFDAETGTQQVLETRLAGYDKSGRAITEIIEMTHCAYRFDYHIEPVIRYLRKRFIGRILAYQLRRAVYCLTY